MSQTIRFRYKPGERLVHETVTTSVFRNIAGEKAERKMKLQTITTVLSQSGEDVACTLQTNLIEGATPGQAATGPVVRVTMTPTGKIVSSSEPVKADLLLPPVPVDVDDYWEVTDQGDESTPMLMEVQVDDFEQRGDDLVAILSCSGEAEVDEGTASAFIEGTIHFSVTRGRRLWSKILFSLAWESGKKVDSTEETTYLGG